MEVADITWESPEGSIRKSITSRGTWGLKPTENCQCNIKITSCSSEDIENYATVSSVTIGSGDTNFERLLGHCLMTMHVGEVSNVIFRLPGKEHSFTLELVNFKSNGLIYEWSANQKYSLALIHKARGIELFNEFRYVDASYRFGKGLKILCSVPIGVDESPVEIDKVKVAEIQNLKTVLYNNLASCYLKHCDYETVLKLCSKVLERDKGNIKALYRQAIARCETLDYEGSRESLLMLLDADPENKAASEKLKFVSVKLSESTARVNAMIKKMFKT